MNEAAVVAYWDSSALLSALIEDAHSGKARRWIARPGVHLMSTLAWAEVHAGIARAVRDGILAKPLGAEAHEAAASGPWRRTSISPDWRVTAHLARKWPLRGADLWHLATAKALREELPELSILTFDERLRLAARGEGLALEP
jgi:predicted nucleic acid-binding protein